MNNGFIAIVDQEVWAHIGITAQEQADAQRLLITTTLTLDNSQQSLFDLADDIENTLDYFKVYQAIHAVVKSRNRNLLETLAEDIINTLSQTNPNVHIDIEIKKFILPNTAHVSVRMSK